MLRASVSLDETQRKNLARSIESALRRVGADRPQLSQKFFGAYASVAQELEPSSYVKLLTKGTKIASLDRVEAARMRIALLDSEGAASKGRARLASAQQLLVLIRRYTGEFSGATIEATGHVASIMHSEGYQEFSKIYYQQMEAALARQRTNTIQTGDLPQLARRAIEAVLETQIRNIGLEGPGHAWNSTFDVFREVVDTVDTSAFRDVGERAGVRSLAERDRLQSLQRAERQEKSLVRRYMELSRGGEDQDPYHFTAASAERTQVLAHLQEAAREFSYFEGAEKAQATQGTMLPTAPQGGPTMLELTKALGNASLWTVVSGETKSFAMLLRPNHHPFVYEIPISHQVALRSAHLLRAAIQLDTNGTSTAVFPMGEASHLAEALFGPIRSLIGAKDELVLIPTGPYRDVPFAVLPYIHQHATDTAGIKFLGTDGPAFVRLPSFVAVISEAARRFQVFGRDSVSVGDPSPEPGFNLQPTPFTSTIALRLPALLGVPKQNRRQTLLGPGATKSALSESLRDSDTRFLIIATHGLLPGEVPDLDEAALVLSPAPRGPDDGLLTVSDIEREHLHSALTILAACNSGTSQQTAQDISFTSIADAFLFAGSHNVLVADGQVSEQVAARMLEMFAQAQQAQRSTTSYARALRSALSNMRSSGDWSEPAYWGHFYIVGDWAQQEH